MASRGAISKAPGKQIAGGARPQSAPTAVGFDTDMFGLITRSISFPTVIGALIGLWLDNLLLDFYTWTFAGMLSGLVWGVFKAFHAVAREEAMLREEAGDYD